MDIFVDIPMLLEHFDTAKSCPDAEIQRMQLEYVREKCWHFHRLLNVWRSDVHLPDQFEYTTIEQHSSVEYLMTVYTACIFWSMSILVYGVLHIIHLQHPSLQASPPPSIDPRNYCLKIAQTLPLFLSRESGEFGKHMIIYPTAVALRWLYATDDVGEESAERKMILNAFDESGSGVYINGFRDSCQRNSAHGEELKMLEGVEAVRKRGRMWLGMDW
jgi:hypothetical protein